MLTVLDHSLIKHKLSIMREAGTSTYIFKQNLDEIAKLMAYEVTRNVPIVEKKIVTPICETIGYEMAEKIVLVPILRAGIGLVDGFVILFRQPRSVISECIGMRKHWSRLNIMQDFRKIWINPL